MSTWERKNLVRERVFYFTIPIQSNTIQYNTITRRTADAVLPSPPPPPLRSASSAPPLAAWGDIQGVSVS